MDVKRKLVKRLIKISPYDVTDPKVNQNGTTHVINLHNHVWLYGFNQDEIPADWYYLCSVTRNGSIKPELKWSNGHSAFLKPHILDELREALHARFLRVKAMPNAYVCPREDNLTFEAYFNRVKAETEKVVKKLQAEVKKHEKAITLLKQSLGEV